MVDWYVYILECEDGSLYTGITTDVDRRLAEHKDGTASKYTTARGVERLAYTERAKDRSEASKREAEIKGLDRSQKLQLISEDR